MINVQKNVNLAEHSTMRLGGRASHFVSVDSLDKVIEAIEFAKKNSLEVDVIGGGSNLIFGDDGFDGLMIINRIMGLDVIDQSDESIELEVGAGQNWDKLVAYSVEQGFCDLACMSLIPGTVGAAPIQNIGAYGQQVSDSIVSVKALDIDSLMVIDIENPDCGFAYRNSRFNTSDRNKYIIISIRLKLNQTSLSPPFYRDVAEYLSSEKKLEDEVDGQVMRRAIIEIRSNKLPNVDQVATSGSFFKNPVISKNRLRIIQSRFPQIKHHDTDDGQTKLYAGQLLELAGFRGDIDEQTGMGTWPNQALVVVNYTATRTQDLIIYRQKIVDKVKAMFGVELVQEPELI